MREGTIITVTTADQVEISFDVDRLFGINTPFIDSKSGERFEVVIALQVVESNKLIMMPVKDTAKQLRTEWAEALEIKRGQAK